MHNIINSIVFLINHMVHIQFAIFDLVSKPPLWCDVTPFVESLVVVAILKVLANYIGLILTINSIQLLHAELSKLSMSTKSLYSKVV